MPRTILSEIIQEDVLRSLFFNEAETAFLLFDSDLNLIDANDFFFNAIRVTRESIIGKNITQISPDIKSSGRYDLYKSVVLTGNTVVIDEMKPHPSFGNFYSRVKAFPVGDGVGIVSKDITDLKEAIDELETFIYKSSHDMRSPISSMLGIINLMETESKSMEDMMYYTKIVKQQAMRLDGILQTLMGTMSIRKSEKKIRPIDFEKIINNILNSFSKTNAFDELKVNKNIILNRKFYSDKLLIVSIFENLIDNAIKYKRNSHGAYIEISVLEEAEGANILIKDNGIGIAEHLQKDVFKMFYRGTSIASGSGLGLYTVNHTVKQLGGTIRLESKLNEGTSFSIFLPNGNSVNE